MKSTLFEKNSLIRRSLLWCSATLAVFLVVACTVSFFAAWERAEALINIAHPDFREQLIADAEKMGLWRKSSKR